MRKIKALKVLRERLPQLPFIQFLPCVCRLKQSLQSPQKQQPLSQMHVSYKKNIANMQNVHEVLKNSSNILN